MIAAFLSLAAVQPLGTVGWRPGLPTATLHAGGLVVTLRPVPCPRGTAGCDDDGIGGAVDLDVTGPGIAPFHARLADEAPYHSATVIRLDRRHTRPGIVMVNDTGGSAGLVTVDVIEPAGSGFRRVRLTRRDPADGRPKPWFVGSDQAIRDVDGDGRPDLVLADPDWGGAWGCNACSPRPPVVMTVVNGHSVDISRSPAVRGVFLKDMAALRPRCLSDEPERNGYCAGYVADAARAGRFAEAWATMLRHYSRQERVEWQGPSGTTRFASFPAALRAFLRHTGYWPGRARY